MSKKTIKNFRAGTRPESLIPATSQGVVWNGPNGHHQPMCMPPKPRSVGVGLSGFGRCVATMGCLVILLCCCSIQAVFAENPEASFAKATVERFLRYVAIDTQSKEDVESIPSTPGQHELAKILEKELQDIGLADVKRDDRAYVYATLPANGLNNPGKVLTVGFISHLDTSSAVAPATISPMIHENYRGGDIFRPMNASEPIIASENPLLQKAIGGNIVTADGTSILGGDDKAGIAEIMTAMEYLLHHPEIPHGIVKLAFTPDEEVDKGPSGFDIKGFGADFAYTVDGCEEGELNDETFNAASAIVTFQGKSSHPGRAKGIMANSLYAAASFVSSLPTDQRPETTEERQGFLHPYDLKGDEEGTTLKILIRDFEPQGVEAKKQVVKKIGAQVQEAFPGIKVTVSLQDTYKNMKSVLASFPFVIDFALEAMKRAEVTPVRTPIRGGTDGADFSFMGLPCANIFSGSMNEHTRKEWVSSKTMAKAVQTIVNIVKITGENPK